METDLNYDYIAGNYISVKERVAQAAVNAGRNPEDITIIGVSKTQPALAAGAAVRAGILCLGENRTDELLAKSEELNKQGLNPQWHMIGSLQRRKVKDIIGRTELIHSVDREELIAEISRQSLLANLATKVLLEVNVSGEVSKHGFHLSDVDLLVGLCGRQIPNVKICGLMTMAPLTSDENVLNEVFSSLNNLYHMLLPHAGDDFKILSMGMSNDFEIAIRNGATHVRIGTAIFGRR